MINYEGADFHGVIRTMMMMMMMVVLMCMSVSIIILMLTYLEP